jgi:hypothetical protein
MFPESCSYRSSRSSPNRTSMNVRSTDEEEAEGEEEDGASVGKL